MIRPKAEKLLRILGMAVACGCLSTIASAQTPTFTLDTVSVNEGQTSAQVGLYISGGVANSSAFNITIDVTSGASNINGNITGVKDPSLSGFTFVQNNPSSTQYRAVLYAPNSSTTFDTATSHKVATLTIPISPSATAGTIGLSIVNKFDADGVTGLTGLGDSSGLSVHGAETASANATRGISVVNGGVNINAITGTTVQFCGVNTLPTEWEFVQAIPFGSPVRLNSASTPMNGFSVTLAGLNTFGYLQTKDTDATIIPSPGTGKILHSTWTVGSNQASAYALPTIRLRAGARDGSFTQTHTFQEGSPSNTAPIVQPITTDAGPRNLELVYYAPASISNANPTAASDGIILAYDLLQFGGNGAVGARLDLKGVTYDTLDPATFTGETDVISLDFTGDSHEFTPIDFKPDSSAVTGIFPANLGTTGGLTINASRAPVLDPNQASGIKFSFGIWEHTFDDAMHGVWNVEADKIYKINFTVASNAPVGTPTHSTRLRFTVGDNDFVADATINPVQDQTIDPRGAGTTYTAFVKFPAAVVGSPVKVSFDVFWVNLGVTNTNITVTLKDLDVKSYNNTGSAAIGDACMM